ASTDELILHEFPDRFVNSKGPIILSLSMNSLNTDVRVSDLKFSMLIRVLAINTPGSNSLSISSSASVKEELVSSPVTIATASTSLQMKSPTSSQFNSIRLKQVQSIDSLTHHPLLNNDDEEDNNSDLLISKWANSVGGQILTKLREMDKMYSDIIQLLISKKTIDRDLLQDHIIFTLPIDEGTKVITMSAIRGFIQNEVFKAIDLMPSEHELSSTFLDNPKNRRSVFDSFAIPDDLDDDYPTIKITNSNVDILLQGMTIQAIVIESSLKFKEISEKIATKETANKKNIELPNLSESLLIESTCEKIQLFYEFIHSEIEKQINTTEKSIDDSEIEIFEKLNAIEKYVCATLYDNIFCPNWSNDNGIHDNLLSSKIAALNLLDLNLKHLGVDIIESNQQESIDMAVQNAGIELQNLNKRKSPLEKLEKSLKKREKKNAIDSVKDVNSTKDMDSVKDIEPVKDVEDASQTAQSAYQKILRIPSLVMSSPEFRALLNDLNSIAQEGSHAQDPDQTKMEIQQNARETADRTSQTLRENAYPLAKNAANIGGEHIKDFSEGKKSLKEATTGGVKSLQSSVQQNVSVRKLSDEERDRLVNRFKNVMIEAHKNQQYQDAISELMDLISQLSQQTQELTQHLSDNLAVPREEINKNDSIQIATKNAKDIVEKFANQSLDPLIDSIREFGRQMKNDQELRDYFKEVRQFIGSSLHDTEFVQNTDYTQFGSELITTGRQILLEKYREQSENVRRQANSFNEAIQNDPTTAQWRRDFDNLITDLFLDESGSPTIKYELIKDAAKIIPVITTQLQYLPLPRIENSDDEYDFAFDNMVLHLPEILPSHAHLSLTSDINLDRESTSLIKNYAFFEVSKIRADARNIAFYYKKKKGVINMNDLGLVDFSIPNNGLRFYLKLLLEAPTKDHPNLRFNVLEAETTIESLKLRIHQSKHDVLYKILTPLAQNKIKKQLEATITEKLKEAVQLLQDISPHDTTPQYQPLEE
ncbi:7926_t:CDS:10, partial [Entrophospora sp. SA101]